MYALAALSLASVAYAQQYHQVIVGGDAPNTLVFQPEALSAAIGDHVIFTFKQKNHTLTQTSFGQVCSPLLDEYTHEPVFDSGFQPVAAEQTDEFPTLDYVVEADHPLWFYCAQKSHCGKGMVFSINCPFEGPNSFENFKNSALEIGKKEAEQAAASSSWAATATSEVYGGSTYAPVYHPTVTETVTYNEQVWTTTYESYPNSPDPTPVEPEGVEHRVIVGGDGKLTFDPPAIAANVRDTIIFEFRSKNHTITQSSFGNPCRKLEFTSNEVGFDSGFQPVDPSLTDNFPTFSVKVEDTKPIWAYCRQGNHCGQGMVFSVNADEASDRNHVAFEALAKVINGTQTGGGSNNTETTNDDGKDDDGKSGAMSMRMASTSAVLLAVSALFAAAL